MQLTAEEIRDLRSVLLNHGFALRPHVLYGIEAVCADSNARPPKSFSEAFLVAVNAIRDKFPEEKIEKETSDG